MQPQMNQNQTPKAAPVLPYGPQLIRMDTVASDHVKWLWYQRLALGKLNLIAGDPGMGKSFLTLDLAARVTTGAPMPGEADAPDRPTDRPPGAVVLLSAEDDPADTICPRLEAAGADLKRVFAFTCVRTRSGTKNLSLRENLRHIRIVCEQRTDTRLVIIDPISAYLGDESGHSNTKVRNLLTPVARMAQGLNVAVLAVTHLNKAGPRNAQSAIYRAMGSLAFTAAARTVHLVTRDPDHPERRLMVPIKNNLCHDRTGYGFQLGPNPDGQTKVLWQPRPTREPADVLLDRLCRTRPSDPDTPTKLDQAVDWLRNELSRGPVSSAALIQAARARGYSKRTLTRARAALDVLVKKAGDTWQCELPDDAPSARNRLALDEPSQDPKRRSAEP
ncbi:MAG: AAA family ATPase [Planctomycetota bacterium]